MAKRGDGDDLVILVVSIDLFSNIPFKMIVN